jgi:transcriptional regulator with XRE-family HTH domain
MTIKKSTTIDAISATQDVWLKMTFGSLVRSLRVSDGISQVDLAKKMGVSKQFLSDVEHNRKEVGIGFAKKISSILGYSIEPLLELLIRDQLRRQNLNYVVQIKKAS